MFSGEIFLSWVTVLTQCSELEPANPAHFKQHVINRSNMDFKLKSTVRKSRLVIHEYNYAATKQHSALTFVKLMKNFWLLLYRKVSIVNPKMDKFWWSTDGQWLNGQCCKTQPYGVFACTVFKENIVFWSKTLFIHLQKYNVQYICYFVNLKNNQINTQYIMPYLIS